jgi:hypothetical protein
VKDTFALPTAPLAFGEIGVVDTADTPVGAGGAVCAAGVTLFATPAKLVPIAFLAVTLHVYEVLRVKPVTVIGDEVPVAEGVPRPVQVTV